MRIYYSAQTNGFYDLVIHGESIPADSVEITATEHRNLMNGQRQGKLIGASGNGHPVLVDPPAPTLTEVKARKTEEINSAAEAAIISGFASNALGAAHTYQSDRDDQLNLVGMVVAGSEYYFKCTDANGVAGYKLHTIEQLKQVLSDGKVVKLTALQHAGVLKAEVAAAGTVEQVNAIEVSF